MTPTIPITHTITGKKVRVKEFTMAGVIHILTMDTNQSVCQLQLNQIQIANDIADLINNRPTT